MERIIQIIEKLGKDELRTLYYIVRLDDPLLEEKPNVDQILRFQLLSDIDNVSPKVVETTKKEVYNNIQRLGEAGLITLKNITSKFIGESSEKDFLKHHLLGPAQIEPIEDVTEYVFRKILFRKFPPVRAQMTNRDDSIVSMQKSLNETKLLIYREHPERFSYKEAFKRRAVFLKIGMGKDTFSCILEPESDDLCKEVAGYLRDIESKLNLLKIEVIGAEVLPLPKIPLYPFFSVISGIESEVGEELAKSYFSPFKDDSHAIKSWFEDFIGARREIVNEKVRQLVLAVPHIMKPLKVFIMYNPEIRAIKARYYTSEVDEIYVKETTQSLANEELFDSSFRLPPKEKWIREITRATYQKKKIYEDWKHPYFAATSEIKQEVEKFNREQRPQYYDANTITNEKIERWTMERINEVRIMAKRFSEIKSKFEPWLDPIYSIIFISKDPPSPQKLRDGIIYSYYFKGEEDKIKVIECKDKKEIPSEGNVPKYVSSELGYEPTLFYWSISGLLYYLSDKMGD